MNAFTEESRDARLALNLEGFIEKLRAPESIHKLVMLAKPATQSVGDFALAAMLNSCLIAAILRGDYRWAYGTLGTLFPAEVTDGTSAISAVPDGTKRYAKVPARSGG